MHYENIQAQNTEQTRQFHGAEFSLDEIAASLQEPATVQRVSRRVTLIKPWKETNVTVHFLRNSAMKVALHNVWGDRPTLFKCEGQGCRLCSITESVADYLTFPVYQRYGSDAGPALLVLPADDPFKFDLRSAVTSLSAVFAQFKEEFWKVPLQITKPGNTLIVSPEYLIKTNRVNLLAPQNPDFHQVSGYLDSEMDYPIPFFSIGLHGQVFAKQAEKLKSIGLGNDN